MPRKILIAASLYWTSPFQVGSHHLARAFAKLGWEVAFISAPISPLHIFGKTDLRQRFGLYQGGGKTDLDGQLWTYVPGAALVPFNAPILRSEWLYRNWQSLSFPDVIAKARANGFGQVDVLMLDSLIQPFWLDEIEYGKSVLRVMDNFSAFPLVSPAMLTIQQEIARRVDLVTYSARALEDYVMALGPKRALHLPNGVNFVHFEDNHSPLPAEYVHIPRPIAVYVGALDFWFDYALLAAVACQLSEISFVLIGPDDLARTKLPSLPNLYLLGRRNYAEIPTYLTHADVGLMPFNVDRYPALVNSVHPLKLYEYLACGLPVVATDWEELRHLNSPALLCHTVGEFAQGIAQAVSQPSHSADRINFVRNADWSQRTTALLANLDLCA